MDTRMKENIWSMCEDAIRSGVSPREIVEEMSEAWPQLLADKSSTDLVTFSRLLKEAK